MGLFNFSLGELETAMFIFFRVAAVLFFAPFFGSQQVPARLKIVLALVFSVALYPLVPAGALSRPAGLFELVVVVFTELTIGLAIAYAVQLIFAAVQLAGTVVDFQMGFGVVNVIDPQTQSQVSITAQFHNIIAVLFFLALNGHHVLIGALVDSFELINPHRIDFSSLTPEFILQVFSATFIVAVKIAAPVMAVLFFLSVGLGLVARTVPQMNVFIVGFPLQIGVGLVMIGLSMPFFSMILKAQWAELPLRLRTLMGTF
jgi:flagellar biosynthetic protein FliR